MGWKPKTISWKRRLTPVAERNTRHGAISIPPRGMADLKETFWGDVYGKAKGVLEKFLEEESARLREVHLGCEPYERTGQEARDYRNGFRFRDFVTRFGVLWLKIARPNVMI